MLLSGGDDLLLQDRLTVNLAVDLLKDRHYQEAIDVIRKLMTGVLGLETEDEMVLLDQLLDEILGSLALVNEKEAINDMKELSRSVIDRMITIEGTDEEKLLNLCRLSDWYSVAADDEEKALELAEKAREYITDEKGELEVLSRIAHGCSTLPIADYKRSVDLFPRVLFLAENTGSSCDEISDHKCSYGICLKELGEIKKAKRELKESRRLSGRCQTPLARSTTRKATFVLGIIYCEAGRLRKAEESFNISLELSQQLNLDVVPDLVLLARTYFFEEKHKSSFETYRLALDKLEENSDRWLELKAEYVERRQSLGLDASK